MGFIDYISGEVKYEIDLKNSSYYRKSIFFEKEGKLLLGCSKNYAVIA